MLGAIIGDIVGSVYEWNNIKTKDFPLFRSDCFFTDDSVMTIAVAEALLNGGAADDFIDAMKKFGRLYPNAGYGGRFGAWLGSNDRKPYNSFGNGAAMRVSPCAWFADSLEEAETLAERSAAVTHNHPEGIKGAKATAAAIYMARTDKNKAEIKTYIEREYGYDLSRTLDDIRPAYSFDETCQKTAPEAIIAFLESGGFEDAIRNAVSLGGDSDTLAAITGSVAEAYYGIRSDTECDCEYQDDSDCDDETYIQRGSRCGRCAIRSDTVTCAFYFLDDTLSAVINAWLDAGKPSYCAARKESWKTLAFEKPTVLDEKLRLTETQFARVRFGLLPEQMEDKWFAYFADGAIHFHRSWTGMKIYEAQIDKSADGYDITKVITEGGDHDLATFEYLIARSLLGQDWAYPRADGGEGSILADWGNFGRMILR